MGPSRYAGREATYYLDHTFMSPSDFENPELIDEYLTSLQNQIDSLTSRNERLVARVDKLKKEREDLRSRLPRRRRTGSKTRGKASREDRSIEIPEIGLIPDLNLPVGQIARPDLKVAVVLDEFSRAGFHYEFSALDVSARTWRETLEEDPPDLLLVESAYRGHDGSWAGRIARFGRPSRELEDLVSWCRKQGIETVFWNKEDPINHDWFTASAALFDWVFTVDSNMLAAYQRRLGHSRVGVMRFAAQPVIHHPGDESDRTGGIVFAGSFYAAKHPARREQMEMLLDPGRELGLHIFDRMDRQNDSRFAWPERFQEHIVGSLTYPQTLEIYRRYRAFINVNTVTGSSTMCARRIYELLASGAQVVSGPSAALDGVPVLVAHSGDDARSLLKRALSAGPNNEGQAWVASGNTMGHRVEALIKTVLG